MKLFTNNSNLVRLKSFFVPNLFIFNGSKLKVLDQSIVLLFAATLYLNGLNGDFTYDDKYD